MGVMIVDGVEYNVAGPARYGNLPDKPRINGVTLEGNLTSSDLHIEGSGSDIDLTDYYTKDEIDPLLVNLGSAVLSANNKIGNLSDLETQETSTLVGAINEIKSDTGVSNYSDLTNKPTINNVELSGNKTTEDLIPIDENTLDFDENGKLVVKNSGGGTPTTMSGATTDSDGVGGLVPKPLAGDQNKVLLGSGRWDNMPIMQGATQGANGVSGAVPTPTTEDRGKALFGDGNYHTIYSSAAGSTVMIVTSESALLGRTVTITDGRTTLTETMGNNGECFFTNVQMYGTVRITCEDENNNIARTSFVMTYWGTYTANLTLNFATLRITTSENALIGMTVTATLNDNFVADATFDQNGVAEIYVEELGTYKLKSEGDGKHASKVITVSQLKQTYNVDMFLYTVYTWVNDDSNSDPATSVTPFLSEYGCDNLNFVPVHMDYTNEVFDYGSWTGTEFFFPRPCMLKYDGTVDYYLDKNDFSKKTNGEASDYDDTSYGGNVMIEFPTVYFKRWQESNKSYVIISDKKIDGTFEAFAHHDKDGNVLPYIYLSAYTGTVISGKLRSISGQFPSGSYTRNNECSYAQANFTFTDREGYYTTHKADWDMVNDLLILLGMSLDTQTVFGKGNNNGYNSKAAGSNSYGQVKNGTLDDKGMFYGYNVDNLDVKVFGISGWWGNFWKNLAGYINANGTQKEKMTYGQEDGSTVNGFNFNGSGYVTILDATPSGTNGGYVSIWKKNTYGYTPVKASGSATTYTCDGLWFNNGQNNYAFVGGSSSTGLRCGTLCCSLDNAASATNWNIGAALSYKGLA